MVAILVEQQSAVSEQVALDFVNGAWRSPYSKQICIDTYFTVERLARRPSQISASLQLDAFQNAANEI